MAWEDDDVGKLPLSNIKHYRWSVFWAGMPAHLGHFFMPWEYVKYIKKNTTIKGV